MSASALVFGPTILGCCIVAAVSIGLRIHGGLDTPTPAADAVLALGRGAVAVGIALATGAAAFLFGWRVRP